MLNTIYIEFYKLKRSKVIFLAPVSAFLPALLALLTHLSGGASAKDIQNMYNLNSIMMNSLMSIVIFALFASYVFNREYTENTINTLFSCSISRTKFFFGKITVIFAFIILTNLFQFIFITLAACLLSYSSITLGFLLKELLIILATAVMQLALVPLDIFITLNSKSIIPSIGFAIGVAVCNLITVNVSSVNFLFPWVVPSSVSYAMASGGKGNYGMGIASLMITFFVGVLISIIQYVHVDVHSGS